MPTPPAPAWISTVSPGREVAELEQAIVGGAERHRHARALDDVAAVRDRPRDDRRDRDELRVRSPQHRGDDLLTHVPVGDTFAHLADRARALVPDDVRGRRHLAAEPVERVAPLDADRLDADQHHAGTAHRIGHVLVTEHVGRTGLVVDGSFHGRPPLPASEPCGQSVAKYSSATRSRCQRLGAEQQVVDLGAAQEHVRVVLPRVADASVDLDALGGDVVRGARGLRLRHRGRDLAVGRVDVRRPCRVVHRDPARSRSRAACRPPCAASPGTSTAACRTPHAPAHSRARARSAASLTPISSAASSTAASSATRRQSSAWSPGGPTSVARVPSNSRRANFRVMSRAGATCAYRAGCSTRNVWRPSRVRAGHEHPVGAAAVHHHRLDAVELVARPPAARAGRGCARAGRRGRPRRSRPCPARVPAASSSRSSSRASARAASVATIAEEKYGPGNTARPISSWTTTASITPRPRPPCASGTSRPVQPRSTILRQSSGVIPVVVVLGHAPHVFLRRLGLHERPYGVTQRVLIRREREVHHVVVTLSPT